MGLKRLHAKFSAASGQRYLSQSLLERIAGGDVVADFGFGPASPDEPQS